MTLAPWNAAAWQSLHARLRRRELPHALLLVGPAGLGKREFADRFAALVLCTESGEDACGRCRACLLVAAGSHPDRMHVGFELRDDGKPRTELVVEQIRKLSERLAMTPQFGGFQVVSIDPADAMNTAAANALLKTLEEPSAMTLILLVADHPARLPATIRSRCQRIAFQLPSTGDAVRWLRANGVADAEVALDAGAGNPGLSLEIVRSGGLALRGEVARDLAALARGESSASEVANRWARADAERRIWFAALLVDAEASAHAEGTRGPLALTAPVDFNKLTPWFRETGRTRDLLRTPVRPELSITELLAAWRTAALQRRRA